MEENDWKTGEEGESEPVLDVSVEWTRHDTWTNCFWETLLCLSTRVRVMCKCMCARSVRTTCTCTNVSYERCVCVHPRAEASHPTVSHIRGVNKVCNIPSPSPSLRSVSSSAPSRTTASRKSVVQVRLHHWPRLHVLCRLAKVDLLMAVYQDEPSERIHSLEADFSSGRPCTTILPGLSPSSS